MQSHDDVIKWKPFPRYWQFVRGIHRSPVNSPQKGQWRGVLMFSLICVWMNDRVNNREAGDLRRYRAHYDVIVMEWVNTMAVDVMAPCIERSVIIMHAIDYAGYTTRGPCLSRGRISFTELSSCNCTMNSYCIGNSMNLVNRENYQHHDLMTQACASWWFA